MNTPRDIAVPLERITWRTGQTLLARDLRAETSALDRLRWMHVRYQHRTWGVVSGLRVVRFGTAGVAVTRGLALDIDGRELLLSKPVGVAAPKVQATTTVYLVISYAPPVKGCTPAPDLSTLCPGVQNPVPLEAGALSWKTAEQVRYGLDVLLARVLVAQGEIESAADNTVQRQAAGVNQPVMWSDVTQAGQTGWTDGAKGTLSEITATVDTSDAGYIETPAYFASVTGATQPVLSFISAATPSSFTLVLRTGFPSAPAAETAPVAAPGFSAATAENAGWQIAWFAIEMQKGLSQ